MFPTSGSRIGLLPLSRFHLSGSPDAVYACSFRARSGPEFSNTLQSLEHRRAIADAMGTDRRTVHRNLREARIILRDVFNADGRLFLNC